MIKIYILVLIGALSVLPTRANAATKYGPAATPLSQDNAYFRQQKNPAPDFWALIPFYVAQDNEYSCSAAAAAMVVNAMLSRSQGRQDSDTNATPADLLKRDRQWRELLSEKGWQGRHGLTLKQLAAKLGESLRKTCKETFSVEYIEFKGSKPSDLTLLREKLSANEKSADDLILLHYVQDEVTGAEGGPYPHISPLGAYDSASGKALILDVDRKWYEPYWTSDETLLKALARHTEAFGNGGIVRVSRAQNLR